MKSVLVTGASSGIGEACALFLAQKNYRVYAGVRSCEKKHPHLHYLKLDVSQAQDWLMAVEQIQAESGSLHALINNAGIALGGPVAYLDLAHFREQFEINYFAVIQGIQACFPLLKAAQRSYVVNISSVNGQVAVPFLGPYCSSKAALESLSESLRHELRPWNIHTSLVQPGVIKTPIFDKSKLYLNQLQSELPAQALHDYGAVLDKFRGLIERVPQQGSSPQKVAERVHKILCSPRPALRYAVGPDAHFALGLRRLLPDLWVEKIQSRFNG